MQHRWVALAFYGAALPASRGIRHCHNQSSLPGSAKASGDEQNTTSLTDSIASLQEQADLSDDDIIALASHHQVVELADHVHGATTRLRAGAKGTRQARRVFVDLGANWGNTLRLYEDLAKQTDGPPWEIYAFEASPLIQPYLEKFTTFLNNDGPRPPLTVPPSGSSVHLNRFAKRYGCPSAPIWDDKLRRYNGRGSWSEMRRCMFRVFKEPLEKLHPEPKLNDSALVDSRLQEARQPPNGKNRYVAVPAAAGNENGYLTIGMVSAQQMIRGGVHSRAIGTQLQVPMVDVVSWLEENFEEQDLVVVKMDIEGAEFPILNSLLDRGHGCLVDTLAMECHKAMGNCPELLSKLRQKQNSCIQLKIEGQGYQAWDHYSSPDKYYPIDPRTKGLLATEKDDVTIAFRSTNKSTQVRQRSLHRRRPY